MIKLFKRKTLLSGLFRFLYQLTLESMALHSESLKFQCDYNVHVINEGRLVGETAPCPLSYKWLTVVAILVNIWVLNTA